MFTVTRRQFRQPQAVQAFSKIMHCGALEDIKFSYQMTKLLKDLDKEHAILHDLYLAHLKKYVKLDDKGDIAPTPGRPGTWELRDEVKDTPEEFAKYQKSMEEFEDLTIEINHPKIPLTKLAPAKLTPSELAAIDGFIIDMEVVSKGKGE